MLIRKENKACETQLTSAGWAPQQGRFSEACYGTEWLELWMIILCAALCCMVLLKSAAGVPKIRASAGTLLAVRTCRDHWCCGSATTAYDWGWGGYIHYQMCPACFSLFIGFLSERQIGSCLAFVKKSHRLLLSFLDTCCLPIMLYNCFLPHYTHAWNNVINGYTCIYSYLIMGNLSSSWSPLLDTLGAAVSHSIWPRTTSKMYPRSSFLLVRGGGWNSNLKANTCGQKSEAQRRGGEFRRSWHLIWGAWQGGRSRACIGTSMTVLGLEWWKASERGRDGIALSDIMHMPAVQGRKHRLSPKCSSPRSQWRKWLFPADLRLNAVKTKPPLAARCPPNSAKPLEPSEAHLL